MRCGKEGTRHKIVGWRAVRSCGKENAGNDLFMTQSKRFSNEGSKTKTDDLKKKTDFCSGLKSTDETSMSDVERNVKGFVGAFFFGQMVCEKLSESDSGKR